MEIYARIKKDLYFDEELQAIMIYGDELWNNLIQKSCRNRKDHSVVTIWDSDDPDHTYLQITRNRRLIAQKRL